MYVGHRDGDYIVLPIISDLQLKTSRPIAIHNCSQPPVGYMSNGMFSLDALKDHLASGRSISF